MPGEPFGQAVITRCSHYTRTPPSCCPSSHEHRLGGRRRGGEERPRGWKEDGCAPSRRAVGPGVWGPERSLQSERPPLGTAGQCPAPRSPLPLPSPDAHTPVCRAKCAPNTNPKPDILLSPCCLHYSRIPQRAPDGAPASGSAPLAASELSPAQGSQSLEGAEPTCPSFGHQRLTGVSSPHTCLSGKGESP